MGVKCLIQHVHPRVPPLPPLSRALSLCVYVCVCVYTTQAAPYKWHGAQLHLYSASGAGGRALALFTAPLLRQFASTERVCMRSNMY